MGKKILIIDDASIVRRQLSVALGKAGFDVVEAVDGLDGLAKLKENPDAALIICDVNMPNMNGLSMIEAIRGNPAHANLPIVILTAVVSAEFRDRSKKAGVKTWIVKPCHPEQVVLAVTKLAT